MKTIFVTMVALLSGLKLFAQGVVNFTNIGGEAVSNFCTLQPLPVGTAFSASLYYAPDGIVDESQFQQVGGAIYFLASAPARVLFWRYQDCPGQSGG
jgi:hypothetical protein